MEKAVCPGGIDHPVLIKRDTSSKVDLGYASPRGKVNGGKGAKEWGGRPIPKILVRGL